LRRAFRLRPLPIFQDACAQPFLDEPQNPAVRNPVLDKLQQPSVVHGIKETANVRVQHPIHLPSRDGHRQCVQRLVLAASWPKAVREADKVHLVDCVQYRDDGALDYLVLERRNTERS
jgi:hypothetical protein